MNLERPLGLRPATRWTLGKRIVWSDTPNSANRPIRLLDTIRHNYEQGVGNLSDHELPIRTSACEGMLLLGLDDLQILSNSLPVSLETVRSVCSVRGTLLNAQLRMPFCWIIRAIRCITVIRIAQGKTNCETSTPLLVGTDRYRRTIRAARCNSKLESNRRSIRTTRMAGGPKIRPQNFLLF